MNYKNKLFIGLILLITFACKRTTSTQTNEIKTPISLKRTFNFHQNLIKDSSLQRIINKETEQVSYTFKDSIYSIKYADTLLWNNIFKTPTPTTTFWSYSTPKQTLTVPSDTSNKLLSNINIALDPGHLAGTPEMAEIEGKLIRLKHPQQQDSIFFYEGELTYLTVQLLKDSLEKLGANVYCTRNTNESAFGYTYFDWLNNHFEEDLDSCLQHNIISLEDFDILNEQKKENTLLSKKIIFHKLFKHLDFYERAKNVNVFAPDLTIIVHYNVDVVNTNWDTPTEDNFSMAFVPGAFMEGELDNQIDFNHFVRLSQTNEIEESIVFSHFLLSGLKKHTMVDIIDDYTEISYINNYCIPTKFKGVFSRNLALTRQIKGTLCYIEALYQDNTKECLLLNETNEKPYFSKRVQEVSNGLLEGIIEYSRYKKLTQ